MGALGGITGSLGPTRGGGVFSQVGGWAWAGRCQRALRARALRAWALFPASLPPQEAPRNHLGVGVGVGVAWKTDSGFKEA